MKSYLLSLCLAFPAMVWGQGSLTPPGAPASTMRTLDQIEPRIPLVAGSPGVSVDGTGKITISQAGSYFLTGNLTTTTDGIAISASNVSLDLRGFKVQSHVAYSGVTVLGTVAAPLSRIAIRNGVFSQCGTGIQIASSSQCVMEDLQIQGTGSGSGIYMITNAMTCQGIVVRRCSIRTTSYGIYILPSTGEIRDSTIEDCTITECQSNSTSLGINFGSGTTPGVRNCTVRNCNISRCQGNGIMMGASGGTIFGNSIINCQISLCGANGIDVSCAAGGTLRGNRLENCQIDSCDGVGIRFSVFGTSTGNLIAGNVVSQCFTGISCSGTNNIAIRNFCTGNTNNFILNANNTNGPIVTTSGTLTNSGSDFHPNANFSR